MEIEAAGTPRPDYGALLPISKQVSTLDYFYTPSVSYRLWGGFRKLGSPFMRKSFLPLAPLGPVWLRRCILRRRIIPPPMQNLESFVISLYLLQIIIPRRGIDF